jgi:ABC-type nitrate/sulfonate/bicarbonate transport system substrate-binding protein
MTAPVGLAQEKAKIRVAIPSASICCLHLFAAQQWKVFEDNGLDVEIIQMRPQVANAAMIAGEIHYFAGVGPNSVAATLRGMASRAVWFASDQLIYSLIARPEIKTLRELRSKRLGVGGLGDTTEVSLRVGLEAVGENPKDFVILGVGNANLMSALESGSIEAALLNPPLLYYAKKKGFRELLDIGSHVKMPLGGLTTLVSTIQNRPAEMRRLMRAMQLAKRTLLQSKERGIDLMMRRTTIVGLALAVLIASPALAAPKKHSRNVKSQEAYAQAQQWQTQRHSTNPRFDVYSGSGQYIGSDPDPMIRQMLQREEDNTGD